MLTLSSLVSARPDLLLAEVDGEAVMMDVGSGQYFALDAIGTRIWNAIATPVEIGLLCRTLEPEFDVALPVIERDVLALVTDLKANGLVRVEP